MDINRAAAPQLDGVEDVRKGQLFELEYNAVSGNPGAPRSRLSKHCFDINHFLMRI
jgi:hypothetical protein